MPTTFLLLMPSNNGLLQRFIDILRPPAFLKCNNFFLAAGSAVKWPTFFIIPILVLDIYQSSWLSILSGLVRFDNFSSLLMVFENDLYSSLTFVYFTESLYPTTSDIPRHQPPSSNWILRLWYTSMVPINILILSECHFQHFFSFFAKCSLVHGSCNIYSCNEACL